MTQFLAVAWTQSYGDTARSPSPELALIADVVRSAPEQVDTGSAIAFANSALADHVRNGMPGDFAYSALLLVVASAGSVGPWFAGCSGIRWRLIVSRVYFAEHFG